MSWLADLVKAFNPCIHQYRVLSTLPNRKKDPTAVTVVRCCDICGDLQTTVVRSEPPPADSTHHHTWTVKKDIRVFEPKDVAAGITPDSVPLYNRYVMQCSGCGEMKSYDARPGTSSEARPKDDKKVA